MIRSLPVAAAWILAWGWLPISSLAAVDDWSHQFTDRFDRDVIGPDWQVLSGEWRIEKGKLVGHGAIICTRLFPGSQRMTYEASSSADKPGDLSAFLSAGPKGLETGAFFGFGSNFNERSKLALLKREVARGAARIKPGQVHRVDVMRDGLSFSLTVDGHRAIDYRGGGKPKIVPGREGAVIVRDVVDLTGDAHAQVGLYAYTEGSFDNVRVLTRPEINSKEQVVGERFGATGELIEMKRSAAAANLIANSGFETLGHGVRDQPADWMERRATRQDTVVAVTDPATAHWGRRCLRLCAPGDEAIQMHSVPSGGIVLEPGQRYRITVWARKEPASEQATVIVEPGRGESELTDAWKQYEYHYEHPANAKPAMGFYVAVRGGAALIDDVAMVREDHTYEPPAEWTAGFAGIGDVSINHAWHKSTASRWKLRVPITFTEVMNRDASDYVAALSLGDVYPARGYRFMSPKHMTFVDAASGEDLPWAAVNHDRNPSFSDGDCLLLRVSCPARSRKLVYLYLDDSAPIRLGMKLATEMPEAFASPPTYPHRLFVDIGEPQFKDRQPPTHRVPSITAAGSFRDMMEDGDARHVISAARNESQAFRVIIHADEPSPRIELTVSDFVSSAGDRIASEHIRIERIAPLYVTKPPMGVKTGWHHDTLLPWRNQVDGPGKRRMAWITVNVPKDAAAGHYAATVHASLAGGQALTLPMELNVFDFTMPDRLAFTPIVGADTWGAFYTYPASRRDTNPPGAYGSFDAQAVHDYAFHLARRHCTPFYYYHHTSPYPIPWQYDPATRSGKFDFSHFDRVAPKLLEAGANLLIVGDRLNSGWRHVTHIGDWATNDPAWSHWKDRPTNHRHPIDSPQGLDMLRAWGRGVGAHLRERGLHDRTFVYVVDEAKSQQVIDATKLVAQTLRSLDPPLRPFGASYAWGWQPYFDHMSAMLSSGNAAPKVREQFEANGIAYWGSYNRPSLIGNPLSIPRIIGPQSFFDGIDHYFVWASLSSFHGWVNAHGRYRFVAQNAGYPPHTFLAGENYAYGLGTLNLPWPADEPLPEGKTRAFAASVRLEAMRESVEDYQYLHMLNELASRTDASAQTRRTVAALLAEMKQVIEDGAIGLYPSKPEMLTHATYVIDEGRYDALRQRMGELIADAN